MRANTVSMTKCLITHLSDNHITVQASVKALRVSLDTHLEGRKSCFVSEGDHY